MIAAGLVLWALSPLHLATAQAADQLPQQQPPPRQASENPATLELTDLESKFKNIADKISPSVVAISASCTPVDTDDALRTDGINGEKLESILERTTRTVGTGFVIDPDGYIVTNEHVIGDSAQVWVTTDNRKVYPAIVIGSDPRADIAVLKVPAHNLPTVHFAPADAVHRGMWSIALGNPYGLAGTGEMSMSVGVVSAVDRSLPKLASQENRLYTNLIQTTAEINPGNSGGPLFGINGEVIGISTAVILPQKQTNGIGFALPITTELLYKIDQLKQGNEISYAYLGVMVSTPTMRQRQSANISDGSGVSIDTVEKDSPAAAALRPGDIVLKVNGQLVYDSDQFVRTIGMAPVAQPAQFSVRRDGQPMTLSIQLRRRELPSVAVSRQNQRIRWQGMLLGPIPANWRDSISSTKRPEHGLLVLGIEKNSPLLKQGVHNGSVITTVAGKNVDAVIDLQNILNDTPAEQCAVQTLPSMKEAVVSGQ